MMSKSIKKRKHPSSVPILDEGMFKSPDYHTSSDPSNALVLPSKTKKKKKGGNAFASETLPEKKINRKKKEKYEGRLKEKSAKVSKTKQKQLKKLTERKQKKETV